MRLLVILTVVALAASLSLVNNVQAHFLPHKKNLTLEERIAYYQRSIKHDKYALHRDNLQYQELKRRDRVLTASRPVAIVSQQRLELLKRMGFHYAAWKWNLQMLNAAETKWKSLHPIIPPIAHWGLWSCITNGAYPGAPHEGNGYNGLYTGWLGMTTPWMGHYPPGSDWVHSSQSAVYAIAEEEYRNSGYSRNFIIGQWPNTGPPCL